MKNYNTTLNEKQRKYMHYHHVKLIKMKIVQMKKILSSCQRRMIKNANFTYSSGGEFKNQTKSIEDQGTKQFEVSKIWKRDIKQLTIKDLISEARRNEEAKNEIEWMEEIEKMGNREDLNYKTRNYVYKICNNLKQ